MSIRQPHRGAFGSAPPAQQSVASDGEPRRRVPINRFYSDGTPFGQIGKGLREFAKGVEQKMKHLPGNRPAR